MAIISFVSTFKLKGSDTNRASYRVNSSNKGAVISSVRMGTSSGGGYNFNGSKLSSYNTHIATISALVPEGTYGDTIYLDFKRSFDRGRFTVSEATITCLAVKR